MSSSEEKLTTGKRKVNDEDMEQDAPEPKRKKDDKFGPAFLFCVSVLDWLKGQLILNYNDMSHNLAITGPFQSMIYLSKTLTDKEPKTQIFEKIKTQGISARVDGLDKTITFQAATEALKACLDEVLKTYPGTNFESYIGTVFQVSSLLSNFAYNWRVLHVGETVVKEKDNGQMKKVRSIADLGFNPITQAPLARGFIMKDNQASCQPTSLGFATVLYHARRSTGTWKKKWVVAMRNQLRGLDTGDTLLNHLIDNKDGSVSMVNKIGEIMMLSGSRYKRRFAVMPMLFCSHLKNSLDIKDKIEKIGFSRWENVHGLLVDQTIAVVKENQVLEKSTFMYLMATLGAAYDDFGIIKGIAPITTFKRSEITKEDFEIIRSGAVAGRTARRGNQKINFSLGFNMSKNNISDFLSQGSSQCLSDPITSGFRVRSFVKYNENLKKKSQQISAGSLQDSLDRILDEIKIKIAKEPKMKMGHVKWLDPHKCTELESTVIDETGDYYFS